MSKTSSDTRRQTLAGDEADLPSLGTRTWRGRMGGKARQERYLEANKANVAKVMKAARECFRKFGIDKTTIEQIATHAGLSRPTVYKYFSGKDELVDRISREEALKVAAEVRKRLVRSGDFGEMLTEALLLIIRTAGKNPYSRRVLEYLPFQDGPGGAANFATFRDLHEAWWGHFLKQAREAGDLASDLTLDEILTWLILAQGMLMIHIESRNASDDQLRRLIRRFVVQPLMAGKTTSKK